MNNCLKSVLVFIIWFMHFRIGPSEKKSVLFADKVFKTEKDYLQTNNQMGDYI